LNYDQICEYATLDFDVYDETDFGLDSPFC